MSERDSKMPVRALGGIRIFSMAQNRYRRTKGDQL